MRSIRLSLMFYFLVMLGAALGTVSVLLYRHAQTTHDDKEVATRELVQARYREAEYRERERLDKDLLQQARTVAQRAVPRQDTPRIQKLHRDWERWSSHQSRSQHLAVQMLAAGLTPSPA